MESKASASFPSSPTLKRKKSHEDSSFLPEAYSSPQGKEKMKYFRRVEEVVKGFEEETLQDFRRRRYCLSSLNASILDESTHLMKQELKFQKSIVKLGIPHGGLFRSNSLQCLRKLHVDYFWTTKNALALTKNKQKSLECLSLSFVHQIQVYPFQQFIETNVTDQFLDTLAKQIGNNIRSLRHVNFDLSRNQRITDKGVKNLAERLGKNHKALQSLRLVFEWDPLITDYGVQSLTEHIGNNLKSLQHLELSFARGFRITDIGVKALAESIGNNLKNLQCLKLDFAAVYEITDAGLMKLGEQIGDNLKSLQSLSLDFDDNNKFTEDGFKSFTKSFGIYLSSLKSFYFNSWGFQFKNLKRLSKWLSKKSK